MVCKNGILLNNKEHQMKENKNISVGVRLTPLQKSALETLVMNGKAKNISSAIQYLINMHIITRV